jgi:ribose 5-phosphate isomerase B
MKIILASDHGGLELKNGIYDYLLEKGFCVEDIGTHTNESTDYPIYGKDAAKRVAAGEFDAGILFCGTGIGISIAANRIKGIRCALITDNNLAFMAKDHNNANMIALGGRNTSLDEAKRYIDTWLNASFDGGERHKRRLAQLDE